MTYEKELKRVRDNKAVEEYMIEKAIQRGTEKSIEKSRKEGEVKGRKEGKLEIVKAMLIKGFAIEDIMRFTGLSQRTIQDLV